MKKSVVKKVLVCVNGTAESIHAAMYAILFARQIGAAVKALYIVDTATIKFLLRKFYIQSLEIKPRNGNLLFPHIKIVVNVMGNTANLIGTL